MNKITKIALVEIIGNMGQDPKIYNLANSGRMAILSVFVKTIYKRSQLEGYNGYMDFEEGAFIKVLCFKYETIKLAEKYVKKGFRVHLEGILQDRTYIDKNNEEKVTREIVIRDDNSFLNVVRYLRTPTFDRLMIEKEDCEEDYYEEDYDD